METPEDRLFRKCAERTQMYKSECEFLTGLDFDKAAKNLKNRELINVIEMDQDVIIIISRKGKESLLY